MPNYVGIPHGVGLRIEDADLSVEHAGLLLVAYETASTFELDGVLKLSRFRRLFGWTQEREDALVSAGFLARDDNTVFIVGYLDTNRTRDEIDAMRSRNKANGARRWNATGNAKSESERESGRVSGSGL